LILGLLIIANDLIHAGNLTYFSFSPSGNIIELIPVHPVKSKTSRRLQFLKSRLLLVNDVFVKCNSSITGR
jgi:hypothetical protein